MSTTITFETEERKITIEIKKNDLNIDEFYELFNDLALAAGYSQSNIDDVLNKESGVFCDACNAMMTEHETEFICPDCGASRYKINLTN